MGSWRSLQWRHQLARLPTPCTHGTLTNIISQDALSPSLFDQYPPPRSVSSSQAATRLSTPTSDSSCTWSGLLTNIDNVNLSLNLNLIRRVEGACISALVPSFLFVIISYLALFVPHDVLVVRASICMFMLLTMWASWFYPKTSNQCFLQVHADQLQQAGDAPPQLPHPARHRVDHQPRSYCCLPSHRHCLCGILTPLASF